MNTVTIPETDRRCRHSEDEYRRLHYENLMLRSRPAHDRDFQRAYATRSATGLTAFSIPPKASIGEIEDLIDLMLAAPPHPEV